MQMGQDVASEDCSEYLQKGIEPDMYSTGLVYHFGNATQFVLCIMHSLLLNTLPRLWSVINPGPKTKSKKRPLYDQKVGP